MRITEENNKEDYLFTHRALIQMCIPFILSFALSLLVGMLDTVMVSTVGDAAVSGVSLVDSINHLILMVLFALTAGGTVVTAQLIGKKDEVGAAKSSAQMVMITVLVMACISAAFLVGGRVLLGLIFGHVEATVMADAVIYMRYTAASFPFLVLYNAVSASFRAKGNTRVSMLTSLGMNILT